MRKTLSGRKLKEHKKPVERTISTHCPDKWLFVDLETGDVWSGRDARFARANLKELTELASVLVEAIGREGITSD